MKLLYDRLTTTMAEYDTDTIEYLIANEMVKRINVLSEITIDDMAQMCNVSKSTISKFIRDLGFEGYKDFRMAAVELKKKERYLWYDTINITDFALEQGIESYQKVLQEDLDRLFKNIDYKKIEQIADDIHNYSKIAAFGQLYSLTPAMNLQYKMSYYRKTIYVTRSLKKQNDYVEKADEDTLIIVFSNQGGYINYQLASDDIERKACFSNTKAKVILITSNKKMEQDKNVDMVLLFEHSTKVQNHPFLFQAVLELIAIAYQKKYGFPMEDNE